MSKRSLVWAAGLLAVAAASAGSLGAGVSRQSNGPRQPASATTASPQATFDRYCVGCHNEKTRTGGLALDTLNLARVADNAEAAVREAMAAHSTANR